MKYFLGRAIYIYIYIFLSDCVRILVTSQSEKLDQHYGRYGDQEILLAITLRRQNYFTANKEASDQ